MYFRMAVLILGIFCVGTAELSPSGMLGELSRDQSVTIPTAGLLVTVYALTVGIGGPVVTAITTRVRRKYLLVLLLLVSVAGNITCAFAPTFELLLVGRMITAVIQGTFMAVCVVTAGNMADGGKKGSAVAGTQLGVNLATVLGVPFGTLVAQQIDWRATPTGARQLSPASCAHHAAGHCSRNRGPKQRRQSRGNGQATTPS